jgi:hypothetical protein
MPEQNPILSIISKSYSVRILRRCASSSLPSFRTRQCVRSILHEWIAKRSKFFEGSNKLFCWIKWLQPEEARFFRTVSGSKAVIRSILSPKIRFATRPHAGGANLERSRHGPELTSMNSISLRCIANPPNRCNRPPAQLHPGSNRITMAS